MLNKISKRLCAILAISMLSAGSFPVINSAHANYNTGAWGAMLSGFGNGNRINSYTRYSYSLPNDINAAIICQAANNFAKKPEVGKTGIYRCVAYSQPNSKFIISNTTVTGRMTFEAYSGARQTIELRIPYQKINYTADEGMQKVQGEIPITISVKVPDKNTSTAILYGTPSDAYMADVITTGEDRNNSNNSNSNNNGSNSNSKNNNGGVKNYTFCSDGSYFCPQENDLNNNGIPDNQEQPNNGGNGNNGNNDLNNNGIPDNQERPKADENKGIKDINGGNTGNKDPNKDLNGNTNLPNQSWKRDPSKTYGDLIADLLGGNKKDSYNAPDPDWNWSRNNNGDSEIPDLNSYFDGVGDKTEPDGMTTDDTGLNGYVDEQGNVYGDPNANNSTNTNGVNLDYIPDNNGQGNSSGLFGGFDSYPDAYQDALDNLDGGMNGDNNGLLGDIVGADKLGDKAMDSILGAGQLLTGAKRGTASDQELYEFARKWLLANGFTAADIANGKNYDPNSAYTEPTKAWDMNRITTLLKGRKITLTSPNETKKSKETSLSDTIKEQEDRDKADAMQKKNTPQKATKFSN